MRIAVIYHSAAGGGVRLDALQKVLAGERHRVVALRESDAGLAGWSPPPVDAVVAVGGDGTVQKVAAALAGGDVPLAIVPAGTANNVARSLGLDAPLRDLVAGWRDAVPQPFDLGIADGPCGQVPFVESAGFGVIAEGIRAMDADEPHAEDGDRAAMLQKARARYREVARSLAPVRCVLRTDGRRRDVELLSCDVMNTPCAGPRLELAPAALVGDGRFDVVTATVDDRATIDALLAAPGNAVLPGRSAVQVVVEGDVRVHVDDRVFERSDGAVWTFTIRPAALQVLVPGRASGRHAPAARPRH